MKAIYVFFLCLISSSIAAQERSDYLSALDSDLLFTTYNYSSSSTIWYSSDSTLINGKWYVTRNRSSKKDRSNPWTQGYYREQDGKLFYISGANSSEELVFDMSANVGDTIHIVSGDYDIPLRVDSVYYKEDMQGLKRKHIRVRCTKYEPVTLEWVEGLGAVSEFFGLCAVDGFYFSIACVYKNDVQFFSNEKFDSCWYSTEVSTIDAKNKQVSFYPNPTHDRLFISGVQGEISGGVYSLYGQKLLPVNGKTIELSSLPEGVYIVDVSDNNDNRYVHRIVKAK